MGTSLIYREMQRYGVRPSDPSLFPPILKACLSPRSPYYGESMHSCLIKQGYESFASIGNSVVDFYMKSGDLKSALASIDRMQNRDSVSWNIIIYSPLNLACRNVGAYHEGLEIHGFVIRSGLSAIGSIQNSLLSMYGYVNKGSARILFDEMSDKDVISWSVMIEGYLQTEEADFALKLFRKMVSEDGIQPDGITAPSVLKACRRLKDIDMGKLVRVVVIERGDYGDSFIGNSLVDMYSKCNAVASAFQVYKEMSRKNNVSWNSMLSGFVLNEKYSEALSLFNLMGEKGIEVDEVTIVNFLHICKRFVFESLCKSVHCLIIRQGYKLNDLVINSLIDAYAKCNLVDLAWKLFDDLKGRDVVAWSTMIAGFTHCGNPDEAVRVFCEMSQTQEKLTVTTILNLLEGCSI
ncbi:hypothetical protein F3Y22_tig00110383pilonHSYRG00271 [Hibiscus syriacus]|uniref:Pentatricopeptide repeat-containing protein n=1 Tax=Hibiscus syriacus TaxID=106335 RepID=A0A6A3AXS3_HIBSY|nr:hypothetical protein F3Y22_tig00110383pilonHSYRG00271 [Hibiscus syriacus]